MERGERPKCACGCGGYVGRAYKYSGKIWNKYIDNHYNPKLSKTHRKHISETKRKNHPIPPPKLCECGCGNYTTLHHGTRRNFCLGHNRKNTHPSKSCRRLLSLQKIGDKNPSKRIEVKNQISSTLKILYSDITKHPAWKGGLSFEPYSSEFNGKLKKQIRDFYDNTCQRCGTSRKDLPYALDVHHIDYNKKNNNPNNLIPLCRLCHIKTNRYRKYWESYFVKKILSYGENKKVS